MLLLILVGYVALGVLLGGRKGAVELCPRLLLLGLGGSAGAVLPELRLLCFRGLYRLEHILDQCVHQVFPAGLHCGSIGGSRLLLSGRRLRL